MANEQTTLPGPIWATLSPTAPKAVCGVYNASLPVAADGNVVALQVDANGNLKTTGGGGGGGGTVTQGTPGLVTAPWFVELSNGTNPVGTAAVPLIIAGNKTNNNVAPGATNLGTLPAIANAAVQTWTEGDQVALSVDLAGNVRTKDLGLELAQGSTTSGQSGPLMQGAVTAAVPGYTTAQTSPLSLNLTGSLRVAIAGTGTAVDNITVVAPANSTGANLNPMAVGTWLATNSPASGNGFVAQRTPAIFKTASVPATASGNTAVWTPAAGKKFRLMRFQITASNLAATAATVITISFQDSAAGIGIGTYDVLLPAVANLQAGITTVSAWVDLGNGFISAAANNVLNANISATVTGATGTFRVNVCGTEE